MRTTPVLLHLAVCLSSLAPLASAWPGWLPDVDTLIVRQDDGGDGGDGGNGGNGDDASTTAAETGASATEPTASPTKTDDGDDDGDDGGDLNTAKPTKDSGKSTKTKSDEKKSTSISIPPDAAVGGVSITEPATSAEPTVLFKIGDNVTLGWNYTGLVVTPTAVDVLISCSTASETWTLTNNMTFATDVSYVWNSQEQADDVESPLLTEMYTLIIKDSEAEVSEFPSAGMLGANAEFTFGLYHKQAYTPWPEWQCVGCNSATSAHDTQAIKLATIMSIITVFTFTWFVTGWGIH